MAPPTGNWNQPWCGEPRIPVPERRDWIRYPIEIDVGEVASGYHLIARAVCLSDEDLLLEYAFAPELSEEARQEVWLNVFYDADISPPYWNWAGAEGEVQYTLPPAAGPMRVVRLLPAGFHVGGEFRRGRPA